MTAAKGVTPPANVGLLGGTTGLWGCVGERSVISSSAPTPAPAPALGGSTSGIA